MEKYKSKISFLTKNEKIDLPDESFSALGI